MKLALLSALVASVAMAQNCGANQYYSPNTNSCKAAGKVGQYCNVVQLCASGNDCVMNVCTESAFIFEMNPTLTAYGEACSADSDCVPGANVCSNNMCSAPAFGAAGDSNRFVTLEVSVHSTIDPITIDFNTIGEATALEGVYTFMWAKVSPYNWEGRLSFQNSTLLAQHLAIHAKDYYVADTDGLTITTNTYGGVGDDVRGMFTALGWDSKELWSTGFNQHPSDVIPNIKEGPKSCVNGNIQADLVGEPDWEVWKAGWIDLIPPALAREDIHSYHYGFDEELHQINYFECYSGAGATGMEEDAADVLARPVHCCMGSFLSRITFGQTNAITSATFAMYGAYIPDDLVLHNGPSAGYIINPNFLAYGL